jgi:hypothetical protein
MEADLVASNKCLAFLPRGWDLQYEIFAHTSWKKSPDKSELQVVLYGIRSLLFSLNGHTKLRHA